MQTPPSWDLSDLFSSPEDEKITKVLSKATQNTSAFSQKYKSKLADFSKPSQLLEVLKEYESIFSAVALPYAYAELIFTVDSTSSKYGAFLQKIRMQFAEITSELIFFELEIANFPAEKIKELMGSEELQPYRHFLEKVLEEKPYRLSEKEEKVMEMKSLTGKQAIIRLFEQELARQQFEIEVEGQKETMTQSEILNIIYKSDDQKIRREAVRAFTEGLLQKESIYTYVINSVVQDKSIDDKLRGFSYPEQSRHLKNEASKDAIEAMCMAVEENYELVRRYYGFKKQVLGLETMYDSDRYAPLGKAARTYTFEQAKELVLASFDEIHPEFTRIAKDFFDKNWIDAAPLAGKKGGAYCECASPAMHPYVFMNFNGSANDVMTLAHELGHAIHFVLGRKQSALNYDCPLTLAETASILAETLVFQKMVSEIEDKEMLLGMYMQKIESIFASVQRQTSMFRFEQDVHGEYRKNGELSKEKINELWRKRQKEMFGDSITLSEEYDNWWMYVSHFIATPFYVYAYAFGELLAFGILKKIKEDPSQISNYMKFLQSMGSKSPQQLAGLFEINLGDQEFWRSGLLTVGEYLEEARSLYSQIK